MRCPECVTEPKATAQYCECCGREVTGPDIHTTSKPVVRCESCGGPSANGALCESCEQAFNPLLSGQAPVAPAEALPASNAPSEEELEAASKALKAEADAKADAARIEAAAKVEAARKIAASVVADRAAAAAKRERETLARGPRLVVAAPTVPVASASRSRAVWLTVAAVAIIGAVGFTQRDFLLGLVKSARPAHESAALPAETGLTAQLELFALPPRTLPPAQTAPTASALPRAVRPPVKPAPIAPGKVVKVVRAVNKPDPTLRQVAPASVARPAVADTASAAPAPAATERVRSAGAAAPTGRFFEPNDVDVAPKVAKRIAPELPADLKGQPLNDIVVVRVLVSQTGDPSRVSLLRKSKHGRSLDNAVIAAVTQWTFSPAKKGGAAVSSWYNIGVPLGQAN